MTDIPTRLRELRKLRLVRDDAKSLFDRADHEFKYAQEHTFMLLEDLGVSSTTVDGVNFIPSSTTYATVQDRAEFVAWAKENAPELLVTKENGDINQAVRTALADGTELPPGLGSYDRRYISQRGGSK